MLMVTHRIMQFISPWNKCKLDQEVQKIRPSEVQVHDNSHQVITYGL